MGFVAVLSGFFVALADTLCKVFIGRGQEPAQNPLYLTFVRWLWSIPGLIPLLIIGLREPPKFNPEFAKNLAVLVPLEVLAAIFYMLAIRTSHVSLAMPFQSLTPIITPLTGFLILGERLELRGIAGIIMVALGGYTMSAHEGGLVAPLRATFKDRGVQFMCITAVLYALTSVLGRKMVLLTSPEFFGAFYIILLTLVLLPFMYLKMGAGALKLALRPSAIKVGIGVSMSFMVACHFLAIKYVLTSYTISLKRASGLFSVILGSLALGEGHFRERFAGALIMFVGVLIVISVV